MFKLAFFITILSASSILSAKAESTGNDLKGYCGYAAQTPSGGVCLGYIAGSLDAFRTINHNGSAKQFCEPSGVTGGQLIAMARKYLDENPEQLHYVASQLILIMMMSTFPCGDQTGNSARR